MRPVTPFMMMPSRCCAIAVLPFIPTPRQSAPRHAREPKFVIAGLDPAIHPSSQRLLAKKMDARVKPAHDGLAYYSIPNSL
jgi:hypothetical protein